MGSGIDKRTFRHRRLATEAHYLFRPLLLLAAAMDGEPSASCRERMGETLARAAMRARKALIQFEPGPLSAMQGDYRRAGALLSGIAAAALFAGRFQVAFHRSAPGAYSRALAPSPEEAMADLLSLCEWANDLWPEP